MKKILIGLITSVFLSTAALAGQFGLGVTGSFAAVGASGTESDKDGTADTSVRKAEAAASAIVPSVFAEYSFDNGFTIGYDYTIGAADVNSSKITRTDDSSEAAQDGDRNAAAEISDVMAVYAELPIHAGLYAKGGFVQMTVDTQDSFSGSGTPGLYGSETVDGVQYGLGYRNTFGENGFYKIEGTYIDMDGITLKSNNADKGNQIQADLDVTKATLAIGVNF